MEEYLDEMRFGAYTVRENLARAVASQKLIAFPEGSFSLPQSGGESYFLQIKGGSAQPCRFGFSNSFLFELAYARTAVPYGCRNCYKLRIVPSNLRGLVALRGILEIVPYTSKCGVDFFNQFSSDIYAGLIYLDGLKAAQATYRELRKLVDEHPDLGNTVSLTIRRGCLNYEAACGPSDRWSFRDEMSALEDSLNLRFKREPITPVDYRQSRMTLMVRWLQFAYNLKDDSYLDFTGGKPLYPPAVSYPMDETTELS